MALDEQMEMGNLTLGRKKLTNEALVHRAPSVFLLGEELQCTERLLFRPPLPRTGSAPDPHPVSDQRNSKVRLNILLCKQRLEQCNAVAHIRDTSRGGFRGISGQSRNSTSASARRLICWIGGGLYNALRVVSTVSFLFSFLTIGTYSFLFSFSFGLLSHRHCTLLVWESHRSLPAPACSQPVSPRKHRRSLKP